MQLRAFAEQVLFGTSLEEKLTFPKETIVDSQPGSPIKTPSKLPRPSDLQLKDSGIQLPHPRLHQLKQDQERGKLLHFFCNHELLATELMALVLLKFPDAPPSFRQGVLATLKEEQVHTQLYISRMQQCGIRFGDLPVNGYFWKNIAPMHDPLDYVTRLSLTFEQANLDYSRTYANVFQEMGDDPTSKILDKIYRDEIEHVGFGLKWFRQWKSKNTSDWQAFKTSLSFPLSPSRAKGPNFNIEGRRKVGLDEDFINELSLFSQSKGRTPNVYYFNPWVELELAQSHLPSPTANAQAQRLKEDLATLPIYLAKQDDIALVHKRPTSNFLKKLQSAGFKLPEIIEAQGNWSQQLNRKINTVRPWAWAPSAIETLAPLLAQTTHASNPQHQWDTNLKELYSKPWSAHWLHTQLNTQWQKIPWLLPQNAIGQIAKNEADVIRLINLYRKIGYNDIVLKAPFGVSGRNQQRLLNNELLSPQISSWLNKIIDQQTCILVEPWLERVLDFSVQYEKTAMTLKLLGITRLHNTSQGQFTAASTNSLTRNCSPDLHRFIYEKEAGRPRLIHFFEKICPAALNQTLEALDYNGPIGIDAFIYKTTSDELRLKPIVEINPRYTMGRVALELQRTTQNNRPATFSITSLNVLQKKGFNTFTEYCTTQESQHPIQLNSQSKITAGFIPLNDPAIAKGFLMAYSVEK